MGKLFIRGTCPCRCRACLHHYGRVCLVHLLHGHDGKNVASSIVVLAGSIVFASTNGDITFATSLQASPWRFGYGKARISIRTAGWILALLCTLPTASAQPVRHVLHSSCTSNTVCDVLQMHLNSTEFTVTDLFACSATLNCVGTTQASNLDFSQSHAYHYFYASFDEIRSDQKWNTHFLVPLAALLLFCGTIGCYAATPGQRKRKKKKKKPKRKKGSCLIPTLKGSVGKRCFFPARFCKKTEGQSSKHKNSALCTALLEQKTETQIWLLQKETCIQSCSNLDETLRWPWRGWFFCNKEKKRKKGAAGQSGRHAATNLKPMDANTEGTQKTEGSR